MVPRWHFWRLFASHIFSELREARFRPASKTRTKATPCVQVGQTSTLRRLRLGEEKKQERKKERKKNRRQDENIMVCPIP